MSEITQDRLQLFEQKFSSVQHLRSWCMEFLDIDLPSSHVDPDSNSSPAEWMYEAYNTYRNNHGDEGRKQGFIVLSSRDSYKTLTESILSVILMCHFNATIAHMAAIEPQAYKAIQYINTFITKVKPILAAQGRNIDSQSKRRIQIKDDKSGKVGYVNVIVATVQGANCVSPDSWVQVKDFGYVKVSDVIAGEQVLTYDYFGGKPTYVSVGQISYTEKPALRVFTGSGCEFVLSTDHLVFTQQGWKRASCLRLGDKVTEFTRLPFRPEHGHYPVEVKRSGIQYIYGSLLGDASLSRPTKRHKNYSMQVSHRSKNRDYVELGAKLVKDALGVSTKVYKTSEGRQYCMRTGSCEMFTKLREEMYPGGRKKVTPEWLSKLEAEGVAYWLMDDGSGCPEVVGSSKDRRISLATCGFSLEENRLITEWFQSKGFKCCVKNVSNQFKKHYVQIEFTLEASRKLTEWVRPWLIPSLAYKFPAPTAELYRRTVDEDREVMPNGPGANGGFSWTNQDINKRGFRTQKEFREWSKKVRSILSGEIVKIEHIGYQKLVDLHIDTQRSNLRSFLINDGVLVHNSEHTTVMSIDEIDVMRFPQAYEEAKYIPAYDAETGQFPITIKTSTRKFAFGLMEKELQLASTTGDKILRWNIIDVTERCPPKRHQPELPKETRYVHPRLPLKNLSKDEWSLLPEAKRGEYERVEAYAGCAKCPLLPVCRMRLAHRSPEDKGGLLKPIQFTIDQFKTTSPDSAEAQLMCWKPSQAGLIYGRFDEREAPEGNVMTIQQAYERYTGQPGHRDMTIKDLVTVFRAKGVSIYAGVDWGFRHYFAITVSALVGKQWWFLDCHAVAGLEFDQMIALAIEVRDMYNPLKWFVDDSQPMFIKEFKKKKMPCPKFKKDVTGGIEATRKQVMDASGNRHLFVVKHERTDFLIKGFQNHHFKLDAAGLPTLDPDDEEYADVMDSVRYKAQNLFGGKANKVISPTGTDAFEEAKAKAPKNEYQDVLAQKIRNLAIEQGADHAGASASKTTFWDFRGDDEG